MITIKIAGLPIRIENRFRQLEIQAKDYFTDEEPLFSVFVTDAEIEEERRISETDRENGYYESVVAYRKIAERLPEYDAFLFHGCAIELGGKAYIITAKSGVGKTTHSRLWISEFSDVSILNGDKPIVRIMDGTPYVCGTPWQGKENYGKNEIRPIGGIAFLARGLENEARKISPSEAVSQFMAQIYLPKLSRGMLSKTLILADRILKCVKLVGLKCNVNPEAARVCREAFEYDG